MQKQMRPNADCGVCLRADNLSLLGSAGADPCWGLESEVVKQQMRNNETGSVARMHNGSDSGRGMARFALLSRMFSPVTMTKRAEFSCSRKKTTRKD